MRRLKICLLGLGPIGRAVATEILNAPDLRLAAVVDPAPDLAGRPVAELLRDDRAGRLTVSESLARVRSRPDAVAHLSASRFPVAARQLGAALALGAPIVSTCEELIAARWRWPRPAGRLDRAARDAGLAILPCGVNPGFVMDLLPAALANVMVEVRSVRVSRHVDTAKRRVALQRKTGVGITPAEFRARAAEGTVGHVGLRDSLVFLVQHLPVNAAVGDERLRPILQRQSGGRVPKGRVLGVHQTVRAADPSGRTVASLDLKMAFGLADPVDEIRFRGDPSMTVQIVGGLAGDRATVGSVLASLRWSPHAPAGLG
jgi:4-hydroxy-tetrahydrodipicolinate reductase